MSFHCSASASDWRRPSASATVQRAALRWLLRGVQDGGRLFERERGGDLARPLRRRVDQRGDVAVDALALHRDLERAGDDPVHPQHGGGGQALLEQQVVELLEVFGLQPVEPLAADVRGDVHADDRLVALQRPLPYAAGRDVRQPVREPRLDGVGVDAGDGAGLAPHLELADLLHDLAAGLARCDDGGRACR